MVAVELGPRIRRVRVVRALYKAFVTVAVDSLSPLPTLYLLGSGLWFHSQSGPSEVKVSVPVAGRTVFDDFGMFGAGYCLPQAPLTVVITGQLFCQVIGARTGTRPPG